LPLYFLVLSLNIILFCFIFSENFITGLKKLWHADIFGYFFFTQNLREIPFFFEESWSLTIEEWSYLVLPVLFFSIIHFGKLSVKNSVLVGIITILILSMIARYMFWLSIYSNTQLTEWEMQVQFREITPLRLDAIALGVLGAWIHLYFKYRWLKFRWLSLAFGLMMCLYFRELSASTIQNIKHANGFLFVIIENTFGCFGVLCLLPVLTTWKTQKGFLGKTIEYISLISYSMYLLNLTFLIGLIKHFFSPQSVNDSYLNVVVYWVLLIGLSSGSYYYFEKPLTALREKFLIKEKTEVLATIDL
jgi:peptidoglycan/LPS O-acetylase OafA/YrhL